MQPKQVICKTLIALLLCVVLVVACFFWLDQPLVYWLAAHHTRSMYVLQWVANDIATILLVLTYLTLFYAAIAWIGKSWSVRIRSWMIVALGLALTIFIKDGFKKVFGRYWADTFICQNPSLLANHVYGFNWFDAGVVAQSFPSGHSALITAFAALLSQQCNSYRWLWWLIAIVVMAAQVILYYHYLSDVIAGATLGYLVSLYTIAISSIREA